jgi:hypothetical protein
MRENSASALSDEEYLRRTRAHLELLDLRKHRPFVKVDQITTKEKDAKSASKKAKGKPKKDHPKRHIPAVESVQEEL